MSGQPVNDQFNFLLVATAASSGGQGGEKKTRKKAKCLDHT
jgi:hypothetical protein